MYPPAGFCTRNRVETEELPLLLIEKAEKNRNVPPLGIVRGFFLELIPRRVDLGHLQLRPPTAVLYRRGHRL